MVPPRSDTIATAQYAFDKWPRVNDELGSQKDRDVVAFVVARHEGLLGRPSAADGFPTTAPQDMVRKADPVM
jgi:hypothetical protein